MNIDSLTPSDLADLKAKLFPDANQAPGGRSPNRPRQLHDLRLLPTKDDPRPTFFWSAEPSRDFVVTHTPYPRLLWHGVTNTEVTVYSQREHLEHVESGYVEQPIGTVVVDPVQSLADQLAGLPKDEQTLILAAQQATRRESLTAKLASLSDADLEKLLNSQEKKPARKGKVA